MKPNPRERGTNDSVTARNAIAANLLAKGRYRDALNALNEAIQLAPSDPHSYAIRATVFERMGMLPQAEGDRAKATRLASAGGYSQDDVFGVPTQAPATRARRRQAQPPTERPTSVAPQVRFPTGIVFAVVFFIVLIGATGGAFIGLASVLRDFEVDLPSIGSDPFNETPAPTAAPSDQAAQTPTASPTPIPPAATTGSPFAFTKLEAAWKAKGITAAIVAPTSGFNGFKISPLDVTLSGPGSAQMSIFFYETRDAPKQDWDLVSGQRPAPKAGHTIPAHASIWWNANVIIVVRSLSGEMNNPAFDAFIGLTP